MVRVSWILRAWLALVVGLMGAGTASAQYGADRGEYQILQARYGTEAHNVDVTARLQELARQDTRLRITNSTFGVDPDIGAHKTLRIFARGADGIVRTFDTTEGGTVDGAQFTSWSSGNWTGYGNAGGFNWQGPLAANGGDRGEYQILAARYGTESHNIDVTQRLRELARRDTTFRVANATFGGDPAVGVHKTLRIFARDASGATRTFEYGENGLVDGAVFTGWGGGNWGYNAGNGNWQGGYGPGNGGAAGDEGEYQIVQARYGTAAHNIDVTQRLQELARRDMRFRVVNAVFGDDPDVGAHKTLRIFARGRDGVLRTFEYTEGGTVDGTQFTGWGSGRWNHERRPLGWEGRGEQR